MAGGEQKGGIRDPQSPHRGVHAGVNGSLRNMIGQLPSVAGEMKGRQVGGRDEKAERRRRAT